MPITNDSQNEIIGKVILNFLTGVITIIVLYLLVFFPYPVSGDSMTPSLVTGDHLLTEDLTYLFRQVRRGDIVVFANPENAATVLIKRVIALSGETVLIKEGDIFINDQLLYEPYLEDDETTKGIIRIRDKIPFKVGQNQVVVMGDNRSQSHDSRHFGAIPISSIQGKAIFRYWPIGRIGFVE